MNTIKEYLKDTYSCMNNGKIVYTGADERGSFFILDKTIFYPQGGGQPSDKGYVISKGISFNVYDVRVINNQVRHYSEGDLTLLCDQTVELIVDREIRLLHAKLHTAGHLISNLIVREYPQYKAVKGHHFPKEAYIEFIVDSEHFPEINILGLNSKLCTAIDSNLTIQTFNITADQLSNYCFNISYQIPTTDIIRLIKISSFDYQPCGGTHVRSVSELKGLFIVKVKNKGKNTVKVSYEIL